MKRSSVLTLLASLSLLLSACGNDSSPAQPSQPPAEDTVISGTLTAAPGGDVAGTTIKACLEPACQTAEQTITVSQAGTSAPFTISDLQAGSSYTLQALQDTNADGVADAEEASGTASPVVAPAQEVSLALQVASAPPPSEDPPTEQDSDLQGTWSGSGARTDTNQAFDLTLDVTQGDASSVEATATFDGVVSNPIDMSGTLDGTDLPLASSGGGFTFTTIVSGTTMVGRGLVNLRDSGATPMIFLVSKDSDAPSGGSLSVVGQKR